jgi:cell division protein FtsW (lipid II flippase)
MTDPSNFHYFLEHIEKLIVWLVVCSIVFFISWKTIKKYRLLLFIVTLCGLFLVFTPLKLEILGAARWITVAGQTIQPGEFFKLGFVLFLAWRLLKKIRVLNERQFYFWFLLLTWLFFLIFALMPDFGTILVLWLTGMTMYWYVGGKRYYILLTFAIGVWWLMLVMPFYPYLQVRVDNFLNPETDQRNRGAWWQIQQALIAVGAWGLVGKGYGKWLQKFGYIPFAQNDFVFAAFAEEIGFLWNSVLLTLYFLLAYFFLRRIEYIPDEYDQLVWVGILASIILQVFVHIGVNIKLIPLTGMTLPFMSYGGSALIVNMVQVVLLYKIAYQQWVVIPEKKKITKLAF